MENFSFKHRGWFVGKRIGGAILIAFAIILLVLGRDSLKLIDWLKSIFIIIWGLLFFTSFVGSDKSCIESGEDCLKIRWRDRIGEVKIPDTEIEKITLAMKYVLISRKSKKAVRIALDYLEKEQKTKVYEFLIEYSQQKNLDLEKLSTFI